MMYTTVENASELVNRIIECAGNRFRLHGYQKTTMDEIAREIKLSKRTIYTLFSSKEEILGEVVWRDTVESVRGFASDLPAETPSEQLLLSLCRYIFTDRVHNGKAGSFAGLYSEDPDLREVYRESLRRVLAHLYDDGMKQGRLKPTIPEFAGAVIFAMLAAATDRFHLVEQPLGMFNDTLGMIADAIAYRNRVPFEALG